MSKHINDRGEAVYFNTVEKRGKLRYIILGIGDTTITGRDKQKTKSRTFRQWAQAEAWLKRNGFKAVY